MTTRTYPGWVFNGPAKRHPTPGRRIFPRLGTYRNRAEYVKLFCRYNSLTL